MKKIIEITIFCLIILVGGYFLLNNYLLPYKAKDLITNKLSESLKREVTISKLSYSFKDGIVLSDFIVASKHIAEVENAEANSLSLLSSERVSFNVLLVPLLIQRKLVITHLNINNPQIIINKSPEGTFNISDLLKPSNKPDSKKSAFLITSANINNGALAYTDYSLENIYHQQIDKINFNYSYLPPTSIRYKLSLSLPESEANCILKGTYNIKAKELSLSGNTSNFPLHKINLVAGLPVDYKSLDGVMTTSNISATLDNQKQINIDIIASLNDLNFDKTNFQIKGDTDVSLNLNYDLHKKEFTNISGNIQPKDLSIEGLPYVDSFSGMTGKAKFDTEKVTLEEINGNLLGCPTMLKGVVNLKDLYLKIDAKSDLQLEKAIKILPKTNIEKFKNLKLKGKTYAALHINGSLRQMISLDITGDISLSEVSIEGVNSKFCISAASGKIFLSKDKAEINSITFNFLDETYKLNAILNTFKNPVLDFKVLSDNFFGAGNISITDSNAHIDKIMGNYYTHTYELTGDIENISDPSLTLYGDFVIDAANLDKLTLLDRKNISNLELKGKIPGNFYFQGKLNKWKEATAGIKANTAKIQLKNLNLTDIYLNAAMQAGNVILKNFTFSAYDGIFAMTGDMNLIKQNIPYTTNAVLKDLNLEKLIQDTKLKDKEIKGIVYLKMQLKNAYKNTTGIIGDGGIIIIDGHLMQLPILDTMAKLLGIPLEEKVTFKEAYADFIIKNQSINSENITLISEGFELKSRGSMDFKGNIDFLSNAEFSKEKYEELNASQQVLSMIFNFTNQYITRIRSTGSIGNAQHKLETASADELILEGIKGLKGIGDLLGL